jgi:iron(III) transport system permease protein
LQKSLTLTVAVILLGVIGLLPVLTMVAKSFVVDGAFSLKAYVGLWASGGHLLDLMGHSILLGLLVTSLATVAGVPLGVLLGKTDLPLRRTLTVLFAVPFLIPPYVTAVAWFTVLGSGGPLGRALAPATAKDVSATLFGISGCTGVLFIAFVPIVILLTIAYLGSVDPRLEDAGRLVSRWPGVLRRITLPLIAAPIHFAAVLVFLLTLGEIGVPSYFRYSVYPVEILTQFAAFYDFSAATAAALPLLVLTFAVLAFEHNLLSSRVWKLRTTFDGTRAQIRLGPWRVPLLGIVSVWAGASIVIPFSVLIAQSFSFSAYAEAFSRASGSILRSVVFAAIGATLLTILGFFGGYLVHTRTLPVWRGIDAAGLFLFTLPGTVVGIGLINLWNTPMTNFVYQTPAIIVLGYLAQYAVIPARMTSAVLARVPASLEQAAQLGGANWFTTLRQIVVPLASRGLIAIWVVSYVFCLRDLGVSIVVYPPGSDTLPVRILTLMANGAPSLIAALCVILIAVILLPLCAVALWSASRKRQS